jgi:SAM-dependent methyltransferase
MMQELQPPALITAFDGKTVLISHSPQHQSGWDVYLDGRRLNAPEEKCSADQTRIHLGQIIDLAETPDFRVRHGGTERLVDVHPDLKGFLNIEDQSRFPVNITGNSPMGRAPILRNLSRFPVSNDMVQHVSGNTDQAGYFLVGYSCAIDALRFGVLNSPANKVFDIGCGCGRVGQFIASMLDPEFGGSYTGYDTWSSGIAWAAENLTPVMPHARFTTLGRTNRYEASSSFVLDLPSASHDAFIATSLFTHLRKPAADGYFAEIARILKPGGRAYITYFASKTIFTLPPEQVVEDDYAVNFLKGDVEDTFVDEPQISDDGRETWPGRAGPQIRIFSRGSIPLSRGYGIPGRVHF